MLFYRMRLVYNPQDHEILSRPTGKVNMNVCKTEDKTIVYSFFLCPIFLYKITTWPSVTLWLYWHCVHCPSSKDSPPAFIFFTTGGRPCVNAGTVTQHPLSSTKYSTWGMYTVGNFHFTNTGSKSQTSPGHICLSQQGFSCRGADITRIIETTDVLSVQSLMD